VSQAGWFTRITRHQAADVDNTLDFAKRRLLKPIYTVYRLSQFSEAVQKLKRGEVAGRAVVDFNANL
jgi:D-arabinose 1-dehydrogenase-like Zn-dependent alcohol dehydrogenase